MTRHVVAGAGLLMIDLDNTLIDRDAAFRAAVAAFLAEQRLPADDLAWAMALDAGGYATLRDVAAALLDRYRGRASSAAVHALVDRGAADRVVLTAGVREALTRAVDEGWTCVVVTNGRTAQQEAKMRRTGIDRLVHGWVVSETVGCAKPDPAIFRAAAEAVGASLPGAWVIGDSARADIAGAAALGLSSVWVSNGRAWAGDSCRPTHVAPDVVAAIGHVLGVGRR
ncbi:HAD family hydrolase [Streptomyces fragilis]|uniref:HAD family hydrolase n=1 Tax=Streptomyces fragilis TaxID=67301 RepID=A0ABV2YK23_9ACTN|nr:HAD family hydrolase [Streptomyces fragilis]